MDEVVLVKTKQQGMDHSNKLLDFCFALNENPTCNSFDIQKLINKFLEEETASSLSFLLPVPQSTESKNDVNLVGTKKNEEFYSLNVVGQSEPNPSIQFEASSAFTSLRHPLTLKDLTSSQIHCLKSHLGLGTILSFIAIPIYSEKENKRSLVNGPSFEENTNKPLWIACLINKSGKYNERDKEIVHDCFKVALSILETKTIYEEEKKT
ncbi:unnamed protein product [Lepeophtheirus salmonis]|uniref:(salmon louse) hypothetical protein n=1 Tax=Lepeophtheirus salmonis TaxID=72036 RepID=A0A7R8D492_LEPSM|nr:unnamed protein product [Lepeophtheirus salmonis]CAF3023950.1 unnamed protein product [Lepeophtheirus salmonis]